MKKIVTFVLAIALCIFVPTSFAGCTSRENTLRIYNWGEYMDKSTYQGFEDWYKKKTGQKVKVSYSTFSTNEDLYTEIVTKGADYDLICPSDYMLERMISEQKIKPLFEETQAVINEAVYEPLKELISYDANLEYGMPYIWGTLGIMYNSLSADSQAMNSWSALFPSSGSKKIFMKNSSRDAYTVAMLQHHAPTLNQYRSQEGGYDNEDYQTLLRSIFDTINTETIAIAEGILRAQKNYVKEYEVDRAKDEMGLDISGSKGQYGLFWSCDAGYILSEVEESGYSCGGGGDTSEVNKNLRYVVPEEGSNVWVDSFAIPTTAVNERAANYFLRYLAGEDSSPDSSELSGDVGYDCMAYTGGISAISMGMDMYQEEIEDEDNEFFKNAPEGFRQMYLEMMIPSQATLKRCGIMKDTPEFNTALNTMWENVIIG